MDRYGETWGRGVNWRLALLVSVPFWLLVVAVVAAVLGAGAR